MSDKKATIQELYELAKILTQGFSELANQHQIFIEQLDNVHNIIGDLQSMVYQLNDKKYSYEIEQPQHLNEIYQNYSGAECYKHESLNMLQEWLKKIKTVKDFFDGNKQ